jgi:hexosaminidase
LPGELVLGVPITVSGDSSTQSIQDQFANMYKEDVIVVGAGSPAGVTLTLVEDLNVDLGEEGYQLDINPEGIAIQAAGQSGLFYGMQTLKQLLPAEGSVDKIHLPCMSIVDKPRFGWRGFLLDEARHFFGMETIKKVLDWLAFFKINRFHWHLTDYQGWRVEIKQYPLLTEIGGRRKGSQRCSSSGKYRDMDMTPHAGWYTQDQIREIVSYAAERQITIVPEVDLPGHFGAALAAYPHLGCSKEEREVRCEWGIFEDVACVGSRETQEFLRNVLDEFCDLFPGPYLHLGGDEVRTEQWEACAECRRVKEENKIDHFEGLNSWIMTELAAYLEQRGKTAIVWNEALSSNLTEDIVIMHWTPNPIALRRTKRALKDGYRVIFQTFSESYFDYAYSLNPLKRVYRAKSLDNLSPSTWSRVLGVQGALWTEFVENEERIQWNAFPRLAAKAEVGWSQSGDRNYKDFTIRWEKLKKHLKTIGLHNPAPAEIYNPSIYRQRVALANDVLKDMHAEQKRWELKQRQ